MQFWCKETICNAFMQLESLMPTFVTRLMCAGISEGNAEVGLVIDFPDEETFHTYQKHDLHVTAVNYNKKFVTARTAIQLPLPKSSL